MWNFKWLKLYQVSSVAFGWLQVESIRVSVQYSTTENRLQRQNEHNLYYFHCIKIGVDDSTSVCQTCACNIIKNNEMHILICLYFIMYIVLQSHLFYWILYPPLSTLLPLMFVISCVCQLFNKECMIWWWWWCSQHCLHSRHSFFLWETAETSVYFSEIS